MTKFRYIEKMHKELRANCPEGWSVQAVREGSQLVTVITCEDPAHCVPWLIDNIVENFGFKTRYA